MSVSASIFWEQHDLGDTPTDATGLGLVYLWGGTTSGAEKAAAAIYPLDTILIDGNLSRGDSGFYRVVGYTSRGSLKVAELLTRDSVPTTEQGRKTFTRAPVFPLTENRRAGKIQITVFASGALRFVEPSRTGRPGLIQKWNNYPTKITL